MSRRLPDHQVEIVLASEDHPNGVPIERRLVSVTIDGKEFPVENIQDISIEVGRIGAFPTVTIEHKPTVIHGAAVNVRKRDTI